MSTTAVLAALTTPSENFMNEPAKSIQVYGTAIATIVLIVCVFSDVGATGMSPHNTSRWRGGMFARQRARFPQIL